MITLFLLLILGIALLELIKGLSANGTPPILQKYPWQMDLAYFMWSNITWFRVAFAVAILVAFWAISADARLTGALFAVPLFALWAGIYWLFNRYWVGRFKFLPITQKIFKSAGQSGIDPDMPIIGVDINGEQKAYPAPMLFYHHQIPDSVGGQAILATYCGMCRAGRVYDRIVEGHALDLTLVGAVSFNAVFRDQVTGTWWRQETGEAVKGTWKGKWLQDIPFEQMSLKTWLEKHPNSTILQFDPAFENKYQFLTKLLNYEASLPGWHRQETPPMIIGVEVGNGSLAFDFEELKKARFADASVGDKAIVALTDPDTTAAFIYDRSLNGANLEFALDEDGFIDRQSGSRWDHLGHCLDGPHKGQKLTSVQSYQQFLRAWITFHPETSFHPF